MNFSFLDLQYKSFRYSDMLCSCAGLGDENGYSDVAVPASGIIIIIFLYLVF